MCVLGLGTLASQRLRPVADSVALTSMTWEGIYCCCLTLQTPPTVSSYSPSKGFMFFSLSLTQVWPGFSEEDEHWEVT